MATVGASSAVPKWRFVADLLRHACPLSEPILSGSTAKPFSPCKIPPHRYCKASLLALPLPSLVWEIPYSLELSVRKRKLCFTLYMWESLAAMQHLGPNLTWLKTQFIFIKESLWLCFSVWHLITREAFKSLRNSHVQRHEFQKMKTLKTQCGYLPPARLSSQPQLWSSSG